MSRRNNDSYELMEFKTSNAEFVERKSIDFDDKFDEFGNVLLKLEERFFIKCCMMKSTISCFLFDVIPTEPEVCISLLGDAADDKSIRWKKYSKMYMEIHVPAATVTIDNPARSRASLVLGDSVGRIEEDCFGNALGRGITIWFEEFEWSKR